MKSKAKTKSPEKKQIRKGPSSRQKVIERAVKQTVKQYRPALEKLAKT